MEQVVGNGITDYRHYIYAGSESVAIYSRTSTLVNIFDYLLSDYQGSMAAITDISGSTVVNKSFFPDGIRRNRSTWSGSASNSDLTTSAAITGPGLALIASTCSVHELPKVGK